MIEAEDFARARAVAALQRGDSLALEDVALRPNTALAAGVVVAAIVAAVVGGVAFLTDRPPPGWRDDRTLVVDEADGARYVIEDGVLHPAPTLTSALLAGAAPKPVLVPHQALAGVPVGSQLPGADLPETPPVVPARPGPLLACTGFGASPGLDVWTGTVQTAPSASDGLLVSPPGTSDWLLVTGAAAYPVNATAAEALGYSPAQVRTVPRAWLDLLPRGVTLAPLTVPSPSDGGGVEGVGQPGDVVQVAGGGERLLVQGGQLHPFVNTTSALLAPAPVRQVSGPALTAAPRGAPVGLADAPSTPPRVPAREDDVVGCLDSATDQLQVLSSVEASGTQASPAQQVTDSTGAAVSTVWHQVPGSGVLVGPPGSAASTSRDGVSVVSAGTAYPVSDDRTLSALGLSREQVLALPRTWLAIAGRGPAMTASR
nr:type VII secretion protein EccB [Quadrisphaera sp. RL12-1S]